ncbi:response regulator transcription factor [Pasteuria penetrans]|uniref:response regulator transcription factor n=1 Tax=Pasteuria penetrans TaxID=86005 RepID=UPI000F9F7A1C|nr:response regulator transcription factor [Pasteuria penetrans]
MSRILVVEDDPKISSLLCSHIDRYGYDAVVPEDFSDIKGVFVDTKPDLVLMDVNLPYFDGFHWCRRIRAVSLCPILFISAREGKMEQVMALDNGADDYITKPFDYDVVVAKIRSHLRRSTGPYAGELDRHERILEHGPIKLYPERLSMEVRGKKVELSKKEMMLLEGLFRRPMRVLSREYLLEKLWDSEKFVDENTLNVYITRVRKKLKEFSLHGCIETVRGVGYRLRMFSEDGNMVMGGEADSDSSSEGRDSASLS